VATRYRFQVSEPELLRLRFRAVRSTALRRGLHVWGDGGAVTGLGQRTHTALVWADEHKTDDALVQVVPASRPLTVEVGNVWQTDAPPPPGTASTAADDRGYVVQGGLQWFERDGDLVVLHCAQTVDDAEVGPDTFADTFADLVAELRREPLPPSDLVDLQAGYATKNAEEDARQRDLVARTPARAPLPDFRYHPDPIHTGAFMRSATPCAVCAQSTGWTYARAAYSTELWTLEGDGLCPWCLASGRAADVFAAAFVDFVPYGGPRPAQSIVDVVERRTPGIAWWYHDGWSVHCDDACAYLGPVDATTYPQLSAEAQAAVQRTGCNYLWDGSAGSEGGDKAPVQLFRCLHCGRYDAFQ
jgi:uncharacterized protein CbrC (UPF0167 family)